MKQLNIDKHLERIAPILEKELEFTLQQLSGKKPNSDLVEGLSVDVVNDGLQVKVNDYIKYVESGRKPKTKRIPLQVLIKWAKKAGLGNLSNGELYAIQTSIFNKGIKGVNGLTEKLSKRIDDLTVLYTANGGDKIDNEIDNYVTDKLKQNGFTSK